MSADDPSTPAHPTETRRGQRLALVGLAVNFALAATKLMAGLIGNSYALVADAIESMTDIVGSVVIWGGLHIGAKPADPEHPYGHGKAEALAAFIVAAMIGAAGLGIAVKAAYEIITPSRQPETFTLAVLIVVIIVKEVMYRIVRRAAHDLGSGAVHVDAWHHRSDAITSAAAFVGITVAVVGGEPYAWADPAAALIASGVIIYNAVILFRRPLAELMDEEPTELVCRVRTIAEGVPGVACVEKLTARKSGMRYWVDMHLQVDPEMSVREAHAISHHVKDIVREQLPTVADVLVHIEPDGRPGSSGGDFVTQRPSA
jgi:cation diffusion facilitator family transporter